MKKLIDNLSPEAKEFLNQYKNCNVGVIENDVEFPPSLNKWKVCDVALFKKDTVFDVVIPGKSVDAYIKSQPVPEKSFSVFVSGKTDDCGCLLGNLKKLSVSGFLYKSYLEETLEDFGCIKYNYKNLVTKLIEPYSFIKGGGRKL